jgi:alanine racemase
MRHSSYLEVNLRLMEENFKNIQALAPKAEILPMVKAEAYGNGMIPIAQFLVNECGVRTLGCGSLGEALRIMNECPDLNAEAYVFSDTEMLNENLRSAYLNYNIIPVLQQVEDLEVVMKDTAFSKLPLNIKLDTGMNRLGLSFEEVQMYLPLFKNRGIHHLMTHFARSSDLLKPDDKTHRQYAEFLKIKNFLRDSGVEIKLTSVSNSGAIEQKFGVEETHVRPGLMLYGPPSVTEPILWHGHQISRFVTKVLSMFMAKKGTPIGYGVNVTDKDSLIVILPVGYGDGLIAYDTGTKITINGCKGKIFGRINMDMAYVQFEPEDASKIKIGDVVELWNHDNRVITDIAVQNKTIPYKLMCGIAGRIPRIYKVK